MHLVLNLCPMFQNGPYPFKCFILVLNLYPLFQNGPNPLKCFVLVLILLNLCKKVPMYIKKLLLNIEEEHTLHVHMQCTRDAAKII